MSSFIRQVSLIKVSIHGLDLTKCRNSESITYTFCQLSGDRRYFQVSHRHLCSVSGIKFPTYDCGPTVAQTEQLGSCGPANIMVEMSRSPGEHNYTYFLILVVEFPTYVCSPIVGQTDPLCFCRTTNDMVEASRTPPSGREWW